MINNLFKYAIAFGLIISLIGFALLKLQLFSATAYNIIDIFYKLTGLISIVFLLLKSTFIREKFNVLLKIIGAIFLLILGMNLMAEFNIYTFTSKIIFGYLLFSIIVIFYIFYFYRKQHKTLLDGAKISFVGIIYIAGFMKALDFSPIIINYLLSGCFWSIVLWTLFYTDAELISNRTS